MSANVVLVRVGSRLPTTVVRVEGGSGGSVVVPVGSRSGVGGERWWQGTGVPPELVVGARVGDWFWSVDSGDVWELTEGV